MRPVEFLGLLLILFYTWCWRKGRPNWAAAVVMVLAGSISMPFFVVAYIGDAGWWKDTEPWVKLFAMILLLPHYALCWLRGGPGWLAAVAMASVGVMSALLGFLLPLGLLWDGGWLGRILLVAIVAILPLAWRTWQAVRWSYVAGLEAGGLRPGRDSASVAPELSERRAADRDEQRKCP